MKIELNTILPILLTTWILIKRWLAEIKKILEPLILQCESMAKDGVIDRIERKEILLKAIALLEKDGKIKLSFLQRFFLGYVVNWLAKKLPDFTISQNTQELLTRAKNETAV